MLESGSHASLRDAHDEVDLLFRILISVATLHDEDTGRSATEPRVINC